MKEEQIEWLFNLKNEVPNFLNKLKCNKRAGFYHYSITGDYFDDSLKWGLGNSVFFLKIAYTLGLEKSREKDIKEAIDFIKSYQNTDGIFFDPFIEQLNYKSRVLHAIKNLDFSNIRNQRTRIAETRQAFSALSLFKTKPCYPFYNSPKNKNQLDKYLSDLNWKQPWGAGSHFSHLIFFLHHSCLDNKNELIQYAIDWITQIQNEHDGFWYKGSASVQQKVNGAMKIITGFKVIDEVNFRHVEKIIDNILKSKNDGNACDSLDITYVLKYCNQITNNSYKYQEIKEFALDRLDKFKKQYFPKIGGFSFLPDKANTVYYGAKITKGLNEPDIHGTIMFLWGISIIAQILSVDKKLGFNEQLS
ncbi:MAG: hypothetical protein O6940_10950 [Ignavibacteria bacterium]|nr:hypothetical protein [Ignavibacteria bacterium]